MAAGYDTAELDAALRALQSTVPSIPPPKTFAKTRRRWGLGLMVLALTVPVLIIVPLRVAVLAYQAYQWALALSLLAGMAVASGSMIFLLSIGQRLVLGRWHLGRWTRRVTLGLVLAWVGYGLVSLSAEHTKSEAVQAAYHQLHPLLRLATSTWILADADLVVTDAARSRSDYARMGLPVNERSLHFPQATGYVHALDLRTRGRAEWQNRLVVLYYRSMGFRTLRHVGTADHLHVSLAVH
ncbi:MAG: hypothetical protein RhofKO_41090 [Rhodothermales bacterium]